MSGQGSEANDMARNHWSTVEELDPAYKERFRAWHMGLLDSGGLERKYRELINLAMACILREREVILAHAQEAKRYGAAKLEILGAVEQVMTMGGIPCFRAGMLALDEFFREFDR